MHNLQRLQEQQTRHNNMINKDFEILYQDEYLVAINKPRGLMVHRSYLASRDEVFILQLLRDQIGQYLYPVHRLDRKTTGVLLFALSSEIAKELQQQFVTHEVKKEYQAIVRGYFPEEVLVDYPLTNDRGKTQEAITQFYCLKTNEIDVPFGKHPTSRYSLIKALPQTGRMHQIRKHLNHLRHPIIGDRPHGCNKQNRLFKEKWNMTDMMLHARELRFLHPVFEEGTVLEAGFDGEFLRVGEILGV